jgi:hypothetical protein
MCEKFFPYKEAGSVVIWSSGDGTDNPFYLMWLESQDRIKQGLANNSWDNHPGEVERWADDGGATP